MATSQQHRRILKKRDRRHRLVPDDDDEEEVEEQERVVIELEQGEGESQADGISTPVTPSREAEAESNMDFWRGILAPSDDEEEEQPSKRARINAIQKSIERVTRDVMSVAKELGIEDVDAKCSRDIAKRMLESLDRSYAKKLQRRVQHEVIRSGRRTAKKSNPKDSVAEIDSQPRLTKVASEYGLRPEFPLDLTTVGETDGVEWDFNQEWIQRKALDRIAKTKPGVIMVCPTCAPFSRLQAWNFLRMDNKSVEDLLDAGMRHLCFAALICILQHRAGRYFIFEHPDCADSWRTRVLDMVMSIPGVNRTKFDFCMLGMVGEDDLGIAPAKKTTGIMTNGEVIAEVNSQHRCDGTHRHVHFVHGKAKVCEIYPEPFCRTLCHAYALQIKHDQRRTGRMTTATLPHLASQSLKL